MDSLKYDPLHQFRTGNEKSRAIDELISIKIETDLENQVKFLMKDLVENEDMYESDLIGLEIKNILRDIDDLKKSREQRMKKRNELDPGVRSKWIPLGGSSV